MPADLNGRNTLFGGRLVAWIDEESYIYATCQLDTRDIATVYIGDFQFHSPAASGDIVEIGVEATRFGTTSLEMKAEARNKTTKKLICSCSKIVMVTLDAAGNKIPHGKTRIKSDAEEQMVDRSV
ncbi:MAG: acyl-CoA thioesterase [Planctomycetaceae bacterium]|nr:acyl-CoA thioesterase [Planctomycetaceae bacterium]